MQKQKSFQKDIQGSIDNNIQSTRAVNIHRNAPRDIQSNFHTNDLVLK